MACWNAAKRDFVLLRAYKHADAPHPLALLCACGERPRRGAADERDESRRLIGQSSGRGPHPSMERTVLCSTAK